MEVSVSFGRFESDSLSWEKWSSFSTNKYLEEVEKCSTPGSVAQKKAYFEAHYKRIAAQKAEQLEQEKQMETNRLTTDYQTQSDESNKNMMITVECQSSSSNGVEEELDRIPDGLELNKPEDDVLIQEEIYTNGLQENVNLPPLFVQEDTHLNGRQDKVEFQTESEETPNSLETKMENANLDASSTTQKITPTRKERNLAGTKKQQASPVLKKLPEISTPKTSKPPPTSTLMSASRSTTKKGNGSLFPRSKNPSAVENKKLVPSSLQVSHSLGPANSESAYLTTTRKSLIMEKMGDKDIVKRAFKTFQNNFNDVRSSGYEKSSTQNEVCYYVMLIIHSSNYGYQF
ncbi:hypothetical protein U1Q18_029212 [Sarracenia purpurea var. burkii]